MFKEAMILMELPQPVENHHGDIIKKGQVIGYLEQFGTSLPIKSDVTGEVLKLLYQDGGSFSRSAVNYNARAQTAVSNISNIIMAAAVLVTLLFLMPLFYYTPNVVLAAIIIAAVIELIDYQAAYKLWKEDLNLFEGL